MAHVRRSAPRSTPRARRRRELGVDVGWDCELAKTPEGYYQVRGGIPYAIAKSLAAAPFADMLWMETKTADLADARQFAEAIHAEFPDKMLAYNLSPSFNWDTTGMSDEEMRRFPEELGKLGFVFNFITYGGHQIDGLAAEEFATALRQDGMLALARLQRKLRLVESPYRTPQTLVGGPRSDAALAASSGRTATTKAMGKGSTQHQHLVQTEVPKKLLEEWLALWSEHYQLGETLRVQLRPRRAGSRGARARHLRRAETREAGQRLFDPIQDRHGRSILSVRDQNTFAEQLRQKRLMTLIHLLLIHRYKADAVHYVTPTEDNLYQTEKMKSHGIFSDVSPGGRRDHRRRRQPAAHRRAAGPRPRGAEAADRQGGLADARSRSVLATRGRLDLDTAPPCSGPALGCSAGTRSRKRLASLDESSPMRRSRCGTAQASDEVSRRGTPTGRWCGARRTTAWRIARCCTAIRSARRCL